MVFKRRWVVLHHCFVLKVLHASTAEARAYSTTKRYNQYDTIYAHIISYRVPVDEYHPVCTRATPYSIPVLDILLLCRVHSYHIMACILILYPVPFKLSPHYTVSGIY